MRGRDDWADLRRDFELAKHAYDRQPDFHPSDQMCDLLILGEDHRFLNHAGVDPIALARAAWRTCLCGRREGGSTIAMQLVRTLTGRRERTISRKTREIALAIRLTKNNVRETLPRLYLWLAYYGWRMNNFREACERLGIDPKSHDLHSAAQLVARIKYPQPRKAPPRRIDQIETRCRYLIDRYQNQHQKRSLTEECDEAV